MANLDELEAINEASQKTISERVRRFREVRANRLLEPADTQREPFLITIDELRKDMGPNNPDLDRAAEALNKEAAEKAAQEGAARLVVVISGEAVDQPVLIVKPQTVVDTGFKVQLGKVYVYDHLPDGTTVQRDATEDYWRGTHGRLPVDASKQDKWNRLPSVMQPMAMKQDAPLPCRQLQTKHDAHLGAVTDDC